MKLNTNLRNALLIILVASAVFMDYLDTSIVTVALPEITEQIGATAYISSWVMTSYLLALVCTLLFFGKLADRKGRCKEIFTLGFGIFTVVSFLCGLSNSISELVIFRVMQGAAAGMMVSTSTAIIAHYLPFEKQSLAACIVASAGGAAFAVGPAAGGIITEYLSWYWIFFINVPVGIVGVILAVILIPKREKERCGIEKTDDETKAETETEAKKPFDIAGTILLALALLPFLIALENSVNEGLSITNISLLAAAAVFGFLFIYCEGKHPDPILSVRLIRNKTVFWACISTMAVTMAYLGVVYVVPFLLTGIYGFNNAVSGFILLFPPVAMALISIPIGLLISKYGCMKLCNIGSIIIAIGSFLVALGMIAGNLIILILGLTLIGLGNGFNEGPSIRRIMVHSPADLQGSTGGLIFTFMNIGAVLGVAVFAISASATSGGAEFSLNNMAFSCIIGAVIGIIAYLTSRMARDTIKG